MTRALNYPSLRKLKKEAGFTLVELIVSMVVIAIALIGTLLALNLTNKYSADPIVNRQAAAIGQAYLNEIMTRTFPTSFPCPAPPGGGRAFYTNVCDYQGLLDNGARNQSGTAIAGLESYTVSVTIDGSSAVMGSLSPGTQVVRIDVAVSRNRMPTFTFSAYRTEY